MSETKSTKSKQRNDNDDRYVILELLEPGNIGYQLQLNIRATIHEVFLGTSHPGKWPPGKRLSGKVTIRESSFREKTIRESNHPGNDRIPFGHTYIHTWNYNALHSRGWLESEARAVARWRGLGRNGREVECFNRRLNVLIVGAFLTERGMEFQMRTDDPAGHFPIYVSCQYIHLRSVYRRLNRFES